MPIISNAERFSINNPGRGEAQEVISNYDFATDGGAVGDIALRGEAIPSGAIVTNALIIVDTPPTSGGSATIAVKIEGAADIQAAVAYNGAPWSTAGAKRASVLTSTAAPIVTTASRQPTITVGTAALTAGRIKLILVYMMYDNTVA
jgi:hypothetical protein